MSDHQKIKLVSHQSGTAGCKIFFEFPKCTYLSFYFQNPRDLKDLYILYIPRQSFGNEINPRIVLEINYKLIRLKMIYSALIQTILTSHSFGLKIRFELIRTWIDSD